MNVSMMVIVAMFSQLPLVIGIAVGVCKKAERRLAVYASLVTLFIQLAACFLLREYLVSEPILFFPALMFPQIFVVFQMETAKELQSQYRFFRAFHPSFTVMLTAFIYTVPWWFAMSQLTERFIQ